MKKKKKIKIAYLCKYKRKKKVKTEQIKIKTNKENEYKPENYDTILHIIQTEKISFFSLHFKVSMNPAPFM